MRFVLHGRAGGVRDASGLRMHGRADGDNTCTCFIATTTFATIQTTKNEISLK